jgi:hypothetical protein
MYPSVRGPGSPPAAAYASQRYGGACPQVHRASKPDGRPLVRCAEVDRVICSHQTAGCLSSFSAPGRPARLNGPILDRRPLAPRCPSLRFALLFGSTTFADNTRDSLGQVPFSPAAQLTRVQVRSSSTSPKDDGVHRSYLIPLHHLGPSAIPMDASYRFKQYSHAQFNPPGTGGGLGSGPVVTGPNGPSPTTSSPHSATHPSPMLANFARGFGGTQSNLDKIMSGFGDNGAAVGGGGYGAGPSNSNSGRSFSFGSNDFGSHGQVMQGSGQNQQQQGSGNNQSAAGGSGQPSAKRGSKACVACESIDVTGHARDWS